MFQHSMVSILIFILAMLLALPTGAYMSKLYKGERTLLDFLSLFENFLYKICGINQSAGMNAKQYFLALVVINLIWLVFGFIILLAQGSLFLNPAGNPSMGWSLALNSVISFLTSTNLQHYSGETGATYLSQVVVFMFLQFVSAATGLSVAVALVRGLAAKSHKALGNFYTDFVRSITRILLPLCIITAVLFLFRGVPSTFNGPDHITTLQGDSSTIATGPVAAFLPIKELGSNGGGFFGANDAHPFENPDFFSFILHAVIIFLLPMAFVFFAGHYLHAKRFAAMIFGVMTLGFVLFTIPIIKEEVKGNPAITQMGIHAGGNMEGKEARYGTFYSAFYCGENVCIPAGTPVGFHDSFMPISGAFMLLGMNVDAFFGGAGTGWINMFIFLVIALFIGSLMIGRTPELFGKKIGIKEIQIIVGVNVLQSLIPIVLAAIACFVYIRFSGGNDSLQWLTNKGAHGFTTFLYEYISSVAGNGSGFESLGDNTVFWNLTTSIAMLTGRFIPIAGALWIAGLLQDKVYTPACAGTLKMQGFTFGLFLFCIIIIINVLSLFPPLMLGPVNESLLLK